VADAVVKAGAVTRFRLFASEVMAELRRVTWPDVGQVRQLSFGVVILALVVGAIIAVMDVVLQNVLIKWLPSLFGG
jgi:preprotein translocase SecE subunit